MSAQAETLVKELPQIKITISGAKGVGKSVVAQLIAGQLKLLGHDAFVVEKVGGDKMIVREPERAREFQDARSIKIEVKETKPAAP